MKRYTQEEINAIEKLLNAAKERVMYRKFLVVHLHMKGHTNLQIAEMMSLNKNTVGIYIKAYKTQGPNGLIPKKSPGRPSFMNENQQQELHDIIREKTPDEVGFVGVMHWMHILAHSASRSYNIRPRILATSGQPFLRHSAKDSCNIRPAVLTASGHGFLPIRPSYASLMNIVLILSH